MPKFSPEAGHNEGSESYHESLWTRDDCSTAFVLTTCLLLTASSMRFQWLIEAQVNLTRHKTCGTTLLPLLSPHLSQTLLQKTTIHDIRCSWAVIVYYCERWSAWMELSTTDDILEFGRHLSTCNVRVRLMWMKADLYVWSWIQMCGVCPNQINQLSLHVYNNKGIPVDPENTSERHSQPANIPELYL